MAKSTAIAISVIDSDWRWSAPYPIDREYGYRSSPVSIADERKGKHTSFRLGWSDGDDGTLYHDEAAVQIR